LSKLRIIVTGYVGCVPVGGVAWDYLQYVLGLAKLGHDVYYHEDTFKWPYHPVEEGRVADGTYSASYIEDFFKRYAPELCDHWHYLHLREKHFGISAKRFAEVASTADLFLNISGSCSIPQQLSANCKKIFVDTDPGFNQIKMLEKKQQRSKTPGFLRSHDRYFTYAENIGSADCLLPDLEVEWMTTRMPVVLDLWEPFARDVPTKESHWSTVMTWSEFKRGLVYKGVNYESKAMEFEKIIDLPQELDLGFTLAMGGQDPPLERFLQKGWNVLSGPVATKTAEQYRQFITKSRGEISASKNVYVALRTGWFSCRSACYLAAGRPVVVQDTGFQSVLPIGQGIRIFRDLKEAVNGIREIESNYEFHAKAAYEIARNYFDSNDVLQRLIDDL
jgi:hypothetical protein